MIFFSEQIAILCREMDIVPLFSQAALKNEQKINLFLKKKLKIYIKIFWTMLLIVVSFQTGLWYLPPSGLGEMVSDTFACSLPPLSHLCALHFWTIPLRKNWSQKPQQTFLSPMLYQADNIVIRCVKLWILRKHLQGWMQNNRILANSM